MKTGIPNVGYAALTLSKERTCRKYSLLRAYPVRYLRVFSQEDLNASSYFTRLKELYHVPGPIRPVRWYPSRT